MSQESMTPEEIELTQKLHTTVKSVIPPMIWLHDFGGGVVSMPHVLAQSRPTWIAYLTNGKRYLGFRFESKDGNPCKWYEIAEQTNFLAKLEYAAAHFTEQSDWLPDTGVVPAGTIPKI